ncbi:hypothetical protein ETU10_07195 [Apibacter muscae]|nr:hypothetical protein ETU10_07195 [Apibacter muscae]
MTATQINFCRLTRTTEEEYQTILFNSGCLFAEWYWTNGLPISWKEKAQRMMQTKEYWRWWETMWNIKTQEAFGLVAIQENENIISQLEKKALLEAFVETHQLERFKHLYPDKLTFMAMDKKLNHGKVPTRTTRRKYCKESTTTFQRNRKVKANNI